MYAARKYSTLPCKRDIFIMNLQIFNNLKYVLLPIINYNIRKSHIHLVTEGNLMFFS